MIRIEKEYILKSSKIFISFSEKLKKRTFLFKNKANILRYKFYLIFLYFFTFKKSFIQINHDILSTKLVFNSNFNYEWNVFYFPLKVEVPTFFRKLEGALFNNLKEKRSFIYIKQLSFVHSKQKESTFFYNLFLNFLQNFKSIQNPSLNKYNFSISQFLVPVKKLSGILKKRKNWFSFIITQPYFWFKFNSNFFYKNFSFFHKSHIFPWSIFFNFFFSKSDIIKHSFISTNFKGLDKSLKSSFMHYLILKDFKSYNLSSNKFKNLTTFYFNNFIKNKKYRYFNLHLFNNFNLVSRFKNSFLYKFRMQHNFILRDVQSFTFLKRKKKLFLKEFSFFASTKLNTYNSRIFSYLITKRALVATFLFLIYL